MNTTIYDLSQSFKYLLEKDTYTSEPSQLYLPITTNNDNQKSISKIISAKRLNIIVPIKIFNPLNNNLNEIKTIVLSCGFMNINTLQNSLRSFISKDRTPLLGEALYRYGEKKKLNHKTLIWHNDTIMNLKVNHLYHSISLTNDHVCSLEELTDLLEMSYIDSLTEHVDLYKSDKKDVIMLNEPIDLTSETRQSVQTLLNNINSHNLPISAQSQMHEHFTNLIVSTVLLGSIKNNRAKASFSDEGNRLSLSQRIESTNRLLNKCDENKTNLTQSIIYNLFNLKVIAHI
jgi:hypothetical protein